MPIMPRMDVATPTVAAGMPKPPVKTKGSTRLNVDSLSRKRGVERKRVHRLVNALVIKCPCDQGENHVACPDATEWQSASDLLFRCRLFVEIRQRHLRCIPSLQFRVAFRIRSSTQHLEEATFQVQSEIKLSSALLQSLFNVSTCSGEGSWKLTSSKKKNTIYVVTAKKNALRRDGKAYG